MSRTAVVLALLAALTTEVQAAEIRVLSAGAVEPGLHRFTELVKRETGHELRLQFNTAPQITKRLADNEVYDILISPPTVISQAIKDGKVDASTRVPLGRVGVGIVVRANAAAPTVATVDQFKAALLAAESIVYNTASTGLYLDKLFEKMGVLDQIKPRTTRYPDGASVMDHVIKGKGTEIGFGAITEVRMYEPKGLKFIGPLPAEIQNYTSYEAAVMTGAKAAEPARAALKVLDSQAGKTVFVSAGIE